MYTHPYIAAELDHDRHRDMQADVGQHPGPASSAPLRTRNPIDPHRAREGEPS
jgi:hypothetical protein